MIRHLVVFEDSRWRQLRPLTDTLPVPALAFGASDLARRWIAATGLELVAFAARAGVLSCWRSAPLRAAPSSPADTVLAVNAAVLPGPWVEEAMAGETPVRFEAEDRIACVRAPYRAIEPGLSRDEPFEPFVRALPLDTRRVEARVLAYPWHLVRWNAEAIAADLAGEQGGIAGEVHALAALLAPERITVEPGARIDPFAVLDARDGPISIGAGAIVLPHTVVVGPCAIGPGTQLLGGFVSGSSFGPECRIAGEVDACVWQGYGNKRHHGFVGHSAIAEWVNLGALTTTSDLKNNYGPVRVWIDGAEIDSGDPKVGAVIGAHVKTGIGTLLPTGASVGVGANLFGGGRFTPKEVPAFGWWDGERMVEHRLEAFLATARIAVSRRGRNLERPDEELLAGLFGTSAEERAGQGVSSGATARSA